MTLSKYVSEFYETWKWMVEFLSKFQGRRLKIDRVNSIGVARPLIFINISRVVARSVTSS